MLDPKTPGPPPADVLLTDGSVAVIRSLREEDRAGLEALHRDASDANIRLRFFSMSRMAGQQYVAHLFSPHGQPVVALVAVVDDTIVALGTGEEVAADCAEVAFMVSDRVHGLGLGSLLLEHLAALGRARGIRRFEAEVLADNHPMLRVFLDAGFEVVRTADQDVVVVTMDTAASARALEAADAREAHSEATSLAPLLYPRRVAVVGVRRSGGGIGRAVLGSILGGGFTGELYVVHPSATTIDGVRAYPRLVDVPGHVDLAIFTVPVAQVLDAMRGAGQARTAAVVVISSGFSELGPAGAAVQEELVELARQHSIRLVGPNCLGVMDNDPTIRLNATFTRSVPTAGGVAIASQSGGVGIALLDLARELGLGVASFVSLGNKADVSSNDLLAAWLEDPRVDAAALYLESFGNAPKFARLARRFSERKPLLAVVGGRSRGGQRAGTSHTAAAATPSVGVDALLAQAGAISCRSAEALAETALVLTEQPLPTGRRLAIISNAGGLGVLGADAADECGLDVPEFTETLRSALRHQVNGTLGTSNPIDLGADASADHLSGAVSAVLSSGEADAVLVVLVQTSAADPAPLLGALAEARRTSPSTPLVLVPMGGLQVPPGELPGVTMLGSPSAAVAALGHVAQYAEWRRIPHEEPPAHDAARAAAARDTASTVLAALGGQGGWLTPVQAKDLLSPYGLEALGRTATTATEAVAVADEIGFPVAVKVADPRVVHKSDRGLVRVRLQDGHAVATAVEAFERELRTPDVPVLIQPMVTGVELAVGVVRDPGFGPLVMVAAGGVAVNVWNDRVFLLPPVTARDAARAVRTLRVWPLLNGFRGGPAVDVDGLVRVLVAVGELAADVPQLAELDLNPIIVTTEKAVLVDAKVRLATGRDLDAGVPRRLRERPAEARLSH